MRRLSRPRFSGAQKSLRMEVRRLKAKDLGEPSARAQAEGSVEPSAMKPTAWSAPWRT